MVRYFYVKKGPFSSKAFIFAAFWHMRSFGRTFKDKKRLSYNQFFIFVLMVPLNIKVSWTRKVRSLTPAIYFLVVIPYEYITTFSAAFHRDCKARLNIII